MKTILLKNGVELKAKRKNIGGIKRSPKWRDMVLEACARKNMLLLENIGTPKKSDKVLVACEHHPKGRSVLVASLVRSEHCCHTGNAQSEEGRKQRAATLTAMWDDAEKKVSLLRNGAGHPGSSITKLYICRIKAKDGSSVLKFGRSERGAKRYGSHLVEEIWEVERPTDRAKLIEIYAHLKFSEYSIEADLETSGFTECYSDSLPIEQVIEFFSQD